MRLQSQVEVTQLREILAIFEDLLDVCPSASNVTDVIVRAPAIEAVHKAGTGVLWSDETDPTPRNLAARLGVLDMPPLISGYLWKRPSGKLTERAAKLTGDIQKQLKFDDSETQIQDDGLPWQKRYFTLLQQKQHYVLQCHRSQPDAKSVYEHRPLWEQRLSNIKVITEGEKYLVFKFTSAKQPLEPVKVATDNKQQRNEWVRALESARAVPWLTLLCLSCFKPHEPGMTFASIGNELQGGSPEHAPASIVKKSKQLEAIGAAIEMLAKDHAYNNAQHRNMFEDIYSKAIDTLTGGERPSPRALRTFVYHLGSYYLLLGEDEYAKMLFQYCAVLKAHDDRIPLDGIAGALTCLQGVLVPQGKDEVVTTVLLHVEGLYTDLLKAHPGANEFELQCAHTRFDAGCYLNLSSNPTAAEWMLKECIKSYTMLYGENCHEVEAPLVQLVFILSKQRGHEKEVEELLAKVGAVLAASPDHFSLTQHVQHKLLTAQHLESVGKSQQGIELLTQALKQDNVHTTDKGLMFERLARMHYHKADWKDAARYGEAALQLFELEAEDSIERAMHVHRAVVHLAEMYQMAGRLDMAMEAYERHYAYLVQTLDEDHPLLGSVLDFMYENFAGLTLTGSDDPALTKYRGRSDPQYVQALNGPLVQPKASTGRSPPPEPDIVRDVSNTARVTHLHGDCRTAIRLQVYVLDTLKLVLPPDHPQMGMEVKLLGVMYEKAGLPKEALHLYRQAVSIFETALGLHDQLTGQALVYEATLSHEAGMQKEALFCIDRAIAIFKQHVAEDHLVLATLTLLRSDVLVVLGETTLAEACVVRFLEAVKDKDADAHTWKLKGAFGNVPVSLAMSSAARMCAARQEFIRARAYSKGAFSLQERFLGIRHETTRLTSRYMEKLSFLSAWTNNEVAASVNDIPPKIRRSYYDMVSEKLIKAKDKAKDFFKPMAAIPLSILSPDEKKEIELRRNASLKRSLSKRSAGSNPDPEDLESITLEEGSR